MAVATEASERATAMVLPNMVKEGISERLKAKRMYNDMKDSRK
jgi:hypothetical protein